MQKLRHQELLPGSMPTSTHSSRHNLDPEIDCISEIIFLWLKM